MSVKQTKERGLLKIQGALITAVILILTTVAQAKPLDRINDSEMKARLNDLTALPWNGQSVTSEESQSWTCAQSKQSIDVADPVTHQVRSYVFEFRHPLDSRPAPVVIIIPTIQGTGILERAVAGNLCDNGIASFIADVNEIKQPTKMPAWGVEDRNDRNAVLALETVIDYARHNNLVDGKNIAMMGLSMGGITTTMMAGVAGNSLKAYISVVGAGNMPYTLSYSDEGTVSTLRSNRMQAMGWTDVAVYENKMRETVKFDPLYFASRVPTDNVLMVMAESDTKVPYLAQQETFAAFGRPHQILFSGGHVDSIIQLTYLYMDQVVSFLKDRFGSHVHFFSLHNRMREHIVLPKSLGGEE